MPVTGRRQLEEIAFEITSTESLGHVTTKARKLATRGVRRVFAIDLDREQVFEWSRSADGWRSLLARPATSSIPCSPCRFRSRRCSTPPASTMRSCARIACVATPSSSPSAPRAGPKGHTEGHAVGYAAARTAAILEVLEHRGLQPSSADVLRVRGERDPERLARWAAAGWTVDDVTSLLAIM